MNNHKIYINHIPLSYNEENIKELFSDCGAINEINYPLNKENQEPKGYAFVTFQDISALEKALEKNNKTLGDSSLIVEIATEKAKKENKKKKGKRKRKH